LSYTGKRPTFCAYCGTALPATADDATVEMQATAPAHDGCDEDPDEIGGYRLLKRLGEGGMGRVYEAEHLSTGQRVAVKLISAKYANSPVALERFRREGRLASGVAHPRCVFIFAADEAFGRPYIVMELMPGTTLQDRVDKDGALPVETAIPLILDVIDGLRELHRLGIVHRDVKPSNCLIDATGRVKVADFGLSRSLVEGSAVTQTGSFVGTPLFAAPEQIKAEAVSPRSDVYSVAATLYCLLTGRAPFQGSDAAATLARIASEPAPPMRSFRPDLPESLDHVVLRGLERDPANRWRNLDEFYQALDVFAPGRLSIGGLGARFGAYLIDSMIVHLLNLGLGVTFNLVTSDTPLWALQPPQDEQQIFAILAGSFVWCLYFGLCEITWCCTPGKYFLGLRISQAKLAERPSRRALALRTAVFYGCANLSALVVQVMYLTGNFAGGIDDPARAQRESLLLLAVSIPFMFLGIGAIVCTMRARNGYRGLHEWLSGTRVVLLPQASTKNVRWDRDPELPTAAADDMPKRLGPFDVVGILGGTETECMLKGNDPSLGRHVWIWLRRSDMPSLSSERRNLTRMTRLRWLAGGREGELQWDAFVAPDCGASIAGTPPRPLDWESTRHLLTQLADELVAAESEGTLPATLSPGQVWIWPDGRIALLDAPVASHGPVELLSPLETLARTALWAFHAQPRIISPTRVALGVPLPAYANAILERLLRKQDPYADVETFQSDLAEVADKPVRTSRLRRLAHLALLGALLYTGLCTGTMSLWFLPGILSTTLSARVRVNESMQNRLLTLTATEAADALAARDPIGRAYALVQANEDARLLKQMEARTNSVRAERDARIDALGTMSRAYADAVNKQIADNEERGPLKARLQLLTTPDAIRNFARGEIQNTREEQGSVLLIVRINLAIAWPILWIVWAFVFRGGISYYIMGLSLVRHDGRPALRIQCAWRALLVWGPIAALAVLVIWLDHAYWQSWYANAPVPWMLSASNTFAWISIVLLPLYFALCIYSPSRSPHDFLARTYIVPR